MKSLFFCKKGIKKTPKSETGLGVTLLNPHNFETNLKNFFNAATYIFDYSKILTANAST
jgi:hypothetical protein